MATFRREQGRVIIACQDAADRALMISAVRSAGWADAEIQFPGLTIDPTSRKPKMLDRVMSAVVAAGATTVAVAPQWSHRVLVHADSPVQPAQVVAGPNETALRFTGFGTAFVTHRDDVGSEFQGTPVRYAYYA